MARSITSGMISAITAQQLSPFFLIEADFDSGALNLWTGIGDLSYGGKTYTGTGEILNLSATKETKNIEATGVTVTLSGLDTSIIALAMNEPYQDRPARFYLGALDSAGAVIASPLLVFEGRMDVMPIENNGETSSVSMTVENILVDLNRPNPWNYTPEDQEIYFVGDTGFDRVTGLQEKDIVLGGG